MTPFGCSDHMAVSHTLADAAVVKSFLIFLRVGFFQIRFIFLIYERLFVFNVSAVRRRRVLVCLALVFPLPLRRQSSVNVSFVRHFLDSYSTR